MKKFISIVLAVVLLATVLLVVGCEENTDAYESRRRETAAVGKQDNVYTEAQPVPFFNYSLPRDLWIQFYKASTSNVVRTWSVIVSDYGSPLFMTESIGYPIPMDTQLTNPMKTVWRDSGAILPQAEPNGLYTSPNTNATVIMTVDGKGKVAPIYSEPKVLAFPFPVKLNEKTGMYERVEGSKSTINLDVSGK